ncbi:DNA translocase FtsK [Lactiplantibacillus dongliensis]|uniref:DNA translocase FtsK n=1 Tax=Lactiplantibacillus dongliensis TaxID=2559919 RepID=A0ABW1R5A2_9LACO|nr:DNA translocase FtsK [Lactiplantibacillus dongliensis]
MNHYDGPAFFRKYARPQKKNRSAAASQSTPAADQPTQSATSAAAAPTPPVRPKKVVPATSAAPFSGGTHGVFHPSKVPAQLASAKQVHQPLAPTDTTDYLAIETLLHKSRDSYLLFATAGDETFPVVELQAAQPMSASIDADSTSQAKVESASASQAVAAVSQAATEVFQPTSTSALPTVVFEPTEPSLAASVVVAEQSVAARALPTVVFEPTDPSLAASVAALAPVSADAAEPTVVFEPTQPIESAAPAPISAEPTVVFEPTAPITVANDDTASQVESVASVAPSTAVPSEAPSAAAKPTHGLGLSLDAIMNEEDQAQADLALFKDAPVADDDADLYQPVGVHRSVSQAPTPRVQSTAPRSAEPAPVTSAASEPVSAVHSGDSAAPVLADKELAAYHFPPLALLKDPVIPDESEMDDWIESKASALDESLDAFGVDANVVDWTVGPTVTQFQVKLARGVKVSKITNLNDDLKLALAAKDIRIEAPIPGRNTVGIEIPNKKSRPVMLSEVLNSTKFKESKSPLTVALGVDLFGQPQVTDLRKMPHGLIAGATGSGKSVFINSILVSILYKANPQEVKLLLIDPKAVELAPYDKVPHLLAPVISEPKAASAALKWVVDEMDHRYEKLAAGGARNIEQFNQLAVEHHEDGLKMPYIVIVIDELADLMMVASSEVQDYIARITQKARAAGIHLLVATQRPSVDVVTGLIKNNIPTRIAFMVASQIDSRTILDASGAERLLGRGDMLYLGNGQSTPIRIQGTYVDSEIDDIAQFVRDQAAPHYEFQPDNLMKHEEAAKNQDELMPEILAYLADEETISTSKLQRTFSVGYNRAANIIDDLESRNYVSPAKGSKPRDVYFTADDLTKLQANS